MVQSPTPRVRLGLAAACFSLAACTGTTDFTITESFVANSAGSRPPDGMRPRPAHPQELLLHRRQ